MQLDYLGRQLSFKLDYPVVKPRTALFNVVGRCNARCQYCADWKNDPDPSNDLSYLKIEQILHDLKGLGVRWVVFSGGEPLLRRDIFDIMKKAADLKFSFSIISNGTAMTKKSVHKMAQLGISKIGISVDSLDAARAEEIRGLKLSAVTSAINTLADLKQAEYPNLSVALYVTITRLNIKELMAIANFAKEQGLAVQFQPVHFSGTDVPQDVLSQLWPSAEEIRELASIVDQLIEEKRLGSPIGNREEFLFQIPSFFLNRTFYPGNYCTVAYTDIVIDTNLGVRPCWAMDPIAFLSDHQSINDIWYSSKMRQARKEIRHKKCPGCLYACHLNKSYTPLPKLKPTVGSSLPLLSS